LDFSTTVIVPFCDAVVIILLTVCAFVFFVNDFFNSVGDILGTTAEVDGTDDGATEGFADTMGISEGLSYNEGISDGASEKGFADTLGIYLMAMQRDASTMKALPKGLQRDFLTHWVYSMALQRDSLIMKAHSKGY